MTQAGTSKRVNEDSFQIAGRIYPDTLNAREQKLNASDNYWQLYSITDGLGGAGVGDIASRLVQSFLVELQEDFPLLDPYGFDFSSYIQEFVNRTDYALQRRLTPIPNQQVGSSLALILFAGDTCYTMSIGSCRIYLHRDRKLYRMSVDHVLTDDPDSRPLLYLGHHPGQGQIRAQNLKRMQIKAGDEFYLMTDGVTCSLSDEDIKWVLDKPSPIQSYVESLFLNARRYDARDNQTILGLRVDSLRAFSEPDFADTLRPEDLRPIHPEEMSSEEARALTTEYRLSQLAENAFQSTMPVNPTQISRAMLDPSYTQSTLLAGLDSPYDDTGYNEDFYAEEFNENEAFMRKILDQLEKNPKVIIGFLLVILAILIILLILK